MSDDISIPRPAVSGAGAARTSFTHSYRSRRVGMDTGTKRLLLAASALGAVLIGGMAVWSFTGHHTTSVPTVEADNRPMRVKPENAGGMTAIGGSDPTAPTAGGSDLAPPAEQPDPQALLAQRRVPAPPKPAAAAPASTASAPATTAPSPAPAAPRPAAPTPAATTQATAARPSTSGPLVQLAALESEAGATTEWQRLTHKAPEIFGDRRPVVQRSEQGGKAFWRLRTGGFTDVADATQFCKKVRAKGVSCSLANF